MLDLRVSHLTEANKALHEIRRLEPALKYKSISKIDQSQDVAFLTFSDTSHRKASYGQTSYVSGIFFSSSGTYHAIDWHSSTHGRVSFLSIGAEILAAAESTDRTGLIEYCLNRLYDSMYQLPLVLTVDSNGLYCTIYTLQEGRDYRLRPTLGRFRDSFETGEISVLQWIPGKKHPADALKKGNDNTFRLVNSICASSILPKIFSTVPSG